MSYRFLMVAEVNAETLDDALKRLDGYREFACDADEDVVLTRATPAELGEFAAETLGGYDTGKTVPCFVPTLPGEFWNDEEELDDNE